MTKKAITLMVDDQPVVFSFSDKEHALFLSLGAALAEIQSFETSIAFWLSSLATKKAPKGKPSFEDEIIIHFEKTLGRLIKHFMLELHNKDIADLLEQVRIKRNHIVHNFLRANGWPLMSSTKYIAAIREIDDFRKFLADAEPAVCRHLSDKEKMNIRMLTYDPITGEIDIIV